MPTKVETELEYLWLDGDSTVQYLRSKTKMIKDFDGTLGSCPIWSFGENTAGNSLEFILEPVALFPDPARKNVFLVMCQVVNQNGTPFYLEEKVNKN